MSHLAVTPPPAGSRPTLDRADLVRAAQRGSLAAFNALTAAHAGDAYTLAYHLLGDESAAAAATQAALVSAYRNLGRYRGQAWRAWLLRWVAAACHDALRNAAGEPSYGRAESSAPRSAAPAAALSRLPANQRLAVALVDIAGLDYATAAAALGTSPAHLRATLAHGRAALARLRRMNTG